MAALIGRAIERNELDGLLESVRAGRGRPLVLRAEAGIGKTALLDYVLGAAEGVRVFRMVGTESELEIGYSALHSLLSTRTPSAAPST